MFVVAALYQFKTLTLLDSHQSQLKSLCDDNGVKGTLLLAEEGINGTIAGHRAGIDAIVAYITKNMDFDDLEYKESFSEFMPFLRMKVRLKKEIVTLGVPGISPTKTVGQYVEPKDWNALISNPETIVIDTRNDYEYDIGTFERAIDPKTESFSKITAYVEKNLSDKKDKPIAMFCTGGIRCEKSTSLLKDMGFENVYHLKGGILKYLEDVPENESLWKGECFVFDQRVSVGHGLKVGNLSVCWGCRMPLSPDDLNHAHFEEGVTCHYCYDNITDKHKKRARERHRQVLISKSRKQTHIGDDVVMTNASSGA